MEAARVGVEEGAGVMVGPAPGFGAAQTATRPPQ
jgi:hypothetical protein